MSKEKALKLAVGEKCSKPWEEAIRNAFMPVTPKQSVKTVVSVTESASMSKKIYPYSTISMVVMVTVTMLSLVGTYTWSVVSNIVSTYGA